MTASATVLANLSAKPKRAASPTIEASRRDPTRVSNGTTSQVSVPSGVSAAGANGAEGGKSNEFTPNRPPVDRQFKDIDAEFKASFDAASQIALSISNSSTSAVQQTIPNIAVPTLQTREVQPEPKIFDLGVQTSSDNGSSPTGLGAGITTTNLNMREGPAPNYLLVDVLATGVKLIILEQENGWLQVRDQAGRQGWVNGTYVRRTPN